MQLLHRHVEFVAAGVFKHHELAILARHLHDLQAQVATHAIFLVHHRGTGAERREVAQDGLGIRRRAPAAPLLARALTEELRFAQHRDGW
jgi:hypothetical protein